MNIINNIISSLIKQRLKSIELSINSSIDYQQKILMNHIKFSRNTFFGEKYKFKKKSLIMTILILDYRFLIMTI